MDSACIPCSFHPLSGKWNLYYHLPQDNNWSLSSYTVLMESIDKLESVVELNDKIPENVIKNCMLFIMREGITPMWEDTKNRHGGCFSYKVTNKYVPEVWKRLFSLLCGDSLTVKEEHSTFINGITISPKKNFCIIKIWMSTSDYQDPAIIVNINNLSKQGCLFKKHEPEF